jgi:FAD/FMN-containing dehydrogenase
MATRTQIDLQPLRDRHRGVVLGPDDLDWHGARQAWQLAVDQQPAAIAIPESESDVAAAVDFARTAGLRVAPQATGHNPGALAPALADALLLKTGRLCDVEIEPSRARAGGGARWEDVVSPAHAHGLAALQGSSATVGVTGYSLGGGLGWLARRYGLQANSVTAVELVTADGEVVRADERLEPDLFWALRGGGGNFGVVTAVEFELRPISHIYAGWLVWESSESQRVLRRWAAWAPEASEDVTTAARIIRFPLLPTVPEPLRGREVVMIDGAVLGPTDRAKRLLRPLHELRPELDTFATIPFADLSHMHGDPEEPSPHVSDHSLLTELPADAVDAFVAGVDSGSDSPLVVAELRQLGGALGRPPERHGALPTIGALFAMVAVAIAPDSQAAAAGAAATGRVAAALEPWTAQGTYLGFTAKPVDARRAFEPEAYRRLQRIKTEVDPTRLFRANHPIDPPQAADGFPSRA